MKALPSRIIVSVVLAACLGAPRIALAALGGTLWVPPGVAKLRGVIICSDVGLGPGWCKSADFQALGTRLQAGVLSLTGDNAFASYANRCTGGEFKAALDTIGMIGKAAGHPELANAPIVGCGHSHGGDYWNYFNACIPSRFALIFDKSSGGVQYTGAALKTPMVWEVGTNDLMNSMGHFRGDMFDHRPKGAPMALVLGPGETHGQLGAGPRAMVIELIEAFFNLRVPKDADPSAGPVLLNVIDETTGQYFLGDNYTKDFAPWAMSPDKDALQKTSFLPTMDIANHWKMSGAPLPASITFTTNGVCSTCYAHPASEPAWDPSMGGQTAMPGTTDAGAEPDADMTGTGGAGGSGGAGGAGGDGTGGSGGASGAGGSGGAMGPTPVTPDAGTSGSGDDVDAGAPAGHHASGGCSAGGGAGALPSLLAVLLLALLRWRLVDSRRRRGDNGRLVDGLARASLSGSGRPRL